jgi:hypothetical protein
MVNRVEGLELASKQTVDPIETVQSPNLKDRRRHNDDSKHQAKVRDHHDMWIRKKRANDVLMNPAHRDPLNHYGNLQGGKYGGYHPHSIKMLDQMNEMHRSHSGTSTPAEHLAPLELHRNPQKHD